MSYISVIDVAANQTNGTQITQVSNFPATQDVAVESLPLPNGASTEATQLLVKADLDEIALDTDNLAAIKTDLDKFNFSTTDLEVKVNQALPAGTNVIGHVIADSGSTTAVTGNVNVIQSTGTNLHTVIDSGTVSVSNFPATQAISASSLPLPTGAATSALQTTGNASLSTIAAALTNPLLVLGTVTLGTADVEIGKIKLLDSGGTNVATIESSGALKVDNSAVTQPISATALPLPSGAATSANQSTEITALQAIQAAITNPLPISASSLPLPTGSATAANQATSNTSLATIATNTALPTITKGTQGSNGYTVQDLKDAGRNVSTLFMTIPVVTTSTDALQSLTGFKSGAAVSATTTPAVVTTGKTYRINSITLTYVGIATAGTAKFSLRMNPNGVVAIGSAPVAVFTIGGTAATAGVTEINSISFPDGLEFAAGTGIGVSMVGLSTTQVAAAVGYGQITIMGYEY